MHTQNTHMCMNASLHIHPHTQAGTHTCIYSREHVYQHATHTITPPSNNHQTLYNPWSQHETATVCLHRLSFTYSSSRRIKADRQNCCHVILSTTSPQNAYRDQKSFAQCMTYTFPARQAITQKDIFIHFFSSMPTYWSRECLTEQSRKKWLTEFLPLWPWQKLHQFTYIYTQARIRFSAVLLLLQTKSCSMVKSPSSNKRNHLIFTVKRDCSEWWEMLLHMQSLMLAATRPRFSSVSVKPDKRGSEEEFNDQRQDRMAWWCIQLCL